MPVLTVPGAKSTNRDTLLSITGINVSDVDMATGVVVENTSSSGLTITVGDGTSDLSMTFTGTLANVNAALARVDYLGNTNFNGADTLSSAWMTRGIQDPAALRPIQSRPRLPCQPCQTCRF